MRAWTRREFVRRAVSVGVVAGPWSSTLVAACGTGASDRRFGDFATRYQDALRRARAAGAPVEVTRVAAVGEVEVGPGKAYRTWLYDGAFPGPEIRVREGERLRVLLENRLPDPTTIHWHGIPLPNAMDGVPDVTQVPVAPGSSFVYDFVAEPAGTYMYHSHVGLQLDRGLVAPLVIEERTPHVAYDRDAVVVLDDWLPSAPTPASARGGGMSESMRGMMRRMMGEGRGMREQGMPLSDPARPEYASLLMNGRSPDDPPRFEVRRGERLRLRLVNLASATTFRVALEGHPLTVTHADGRPVEPVVVDALVVGMGERYDAIVEADRPGAWTLAAASVLGTLGPARAVFRYRDARATLPTGSLPEGLTGGRLLDLADLVALESESAPAAGPDRSVDLTLSWGMMMAPDQWSIDGQRYPDADPLEIRPGERVRVSLTNRSPIHHPMHLHGHIFQVGRALKDTVLVPGHMGRVSFEFTGDNPGDWLFHCHNLYHLESGMARVFRYT